MLHQPLLNSENKSCSVRELSFISFIVLCVIGTIIAIIFSNSNNKIIETDFLYINDIHLDPLYNENATFAGGFCRNASATTVKPYPFGQYGCDTPNKTFLSMIDYIKKSNFKPSFILFGGDSIAHKTGYDRLQLNELITFLLNKMSSIYGNIPVLFTAGNNDYEINYGTFETDINDFNNLTNVFSNYLTPEQKTTFQKGLYYYQDIPSQNLRLLLLNTVIYSQRRPFDPLRTDPYGQFEWIAKKSQEAHNEGKKIAIAMHMPPGVTFTDYTQGFHDFYIEKFKNVTSSNNFQFFIVGHTHNDQFIPISSTSNQQIHAISAPSVTVSHNNNPCFRKYTIKDGVLMNYVQYFADIRLNPQDNLKWEVEYDFKSGYSQPDLSNDSINKALNWIKSTNKGLWFYRQMLSANADLENTFYLCILNAVTVEEVQQCVTGKNTLLDSIQSHYLD